MLLKSLTSSQNAMATLDMALEESANICTQKILDKWGGKLAGLDIFTHDQCRDMAFYLMVD